MRNNLLTLIKKSGSVRKFKRKKIRKSIIGKIIEAGVWGPSLFGIQPWHFVVIDKKKHINKISAIVNHSAKKKSGGLGKLLEMSSRVISESKVIIAVYIDNRIKKNAKKYGGDVCMKKGWMAELLSAGAAVQNMFLFLNSIGLGAVWLDAPTIFPKKINLLLKEKNELVTLLSIGYPNQGIRRSHRSIEKIKRFI